jgi:hypothetical protein
MYIVSGDDIQMKQHRVESHDASKEGQNMSGCRNGARPMLLYCLFTVLQLQLFELRNIARGVYRCPSLAENQQAPYRIQ